MHVMLARFRSLSLPLRYWSKLNKKVCEDIKPVCTSIFQQQIPLSQTCDALWLATRESLLTDPKVRAQVMAPPAEKYRRHKRANVEKLRKVKNDLRARRRESEVARRDHLEAVRAHNVLQDREKQQKREKEVQNSELKFKKDPFQFTKRLLRDESEKCEPDFDCKAAEVFLADRYGTPKEVDIEELKQILGVLPESKFQTPFNPNPVRPRDIRRFLKGRKSNSAPGPDGMTYAILKFLPCLHTPLATIFTRMRQQESPSAQEGWETSKSILIFKKGLSNTMENFRRIGLSNVMGKVFHALYSRDLTDYLVSNLIIDPTLQKAFIPGIDGCREHTTVVSELVKNARHSKRTLHLTSLDLRDAFGSTAHSLIVFLLRWARVPEPVCRYIADFLARLRTRVTTRQWTTDPVPIRVGTMQGDTLSLVPTRNQPSHRVSTTQGDQARLLAHQQGVRRIEEVHLHTVCRRLQRSVLQAAFPSTYFVVSLQPAQHAAFGAEGGQVCVALNIGRLVQASTVLAGQHCHTDS